MCIRDRFEGSLNKKEKTLKNKKKVRHTPYQKIEINKEFRRALDLLQDTSKNVFITGLSPPSTNWPTGSTANSFKRSKERNAASKG